MARVIMLTQLKVKAGNQEVVLSPGQIVRVDDPVAGKMILEGKARLIDGDSGKVCYARLNGKQDELGGF